ncbi:MAG: ArsA family ATPase, partial [Deltaproteobacteria bacterium]|nr:ArsA family ATPase [Deltaproteobacteria bacterium]
DDYFAAIQYLFERLRGVDKILTDPQTTTVRLITNPEKIVLKETQRAFMYFCLYKMNIDGIIMNRIIPDNVNDTYFKDRMKSQKQYLKKAEEYFSPIPLFPVNLFRDEVLGYESLKSLAGQIYGDKNPLDRFFEGEPYNLSKEDGEYRLVMKLPFLMKKDVELSRVSDELIVRVGSFKRHVLLPRQVAAAKSVRARMEDRHLYIHFREDDHG